MARSLHVRLDDQSAAALDVVRATSTSDSDAVRIALIETARRRRSRSALRAEVAALAADPVDIAEKRQILDEMAELAPDSIDDL
ncbi:MAG: hypothetical protein H7287_01080 [Thermoleophilia bacterium]|nr:hypothetical protein [Thermoleophilia bacterium]